MTTSPVPQDAPATPATPDVPDVPEAPEAPASPEAPTAPQRDLGLGRAHSARVYDCCLGGKNHYRPDRRTVRHLAGVLPQISTNARVNRAFMHRATVTLAREFGIRQWLDIGTGFPHSPNLHEAAQSIAPHARALYTDNDPIVLSHLRALMTGDPRGRTACLQADATDPARILNAPELTDTLDLTQPVALTMTALLPLVTDDRTAYGLVRRLLDALPRGSALVLTHTTGDFAPEAWQQAAAIHAQAGIGFRPRSRDEVERFFTGLTLLDPGLVTGDRWRPRAGGPANLRTVSDADASLWAGIGMKTRRLLPRLPAATGARTTPGRTDPTDSPSPQRPRPGATSLPPAQRKGNTT